MSALPSDINALDRYAPRRRIVAVTAKTSTLIVYEVPAGRSLKIESLSVCNVGATTITFRLYFLAANESTSTSNAVYYDNVIRGNATLLDDSIRYMNAGDRIAFRADTANAVGLQIHGIEM